MICEVVLVKSVKFVFTLKQFGFSFLDETAVPANSPGSNNNHKKIMVMHLVAMCIQCADGNNNLSW